MDLIIADKDSSHNIMISNTVNDNRELTSSTILTTSSTIMNINADLVNDDNDNRDAVDDEMDVVTDALKRTIITIPRKICFGRRRR